MYFCGIVADIWDSCVGDFYVYFSGVMTDLWNSCVDNCSVEADLSLSFVYYCGISLVGVFYGVEAGVKCYLARTKEHFIPQNDHQPSHNSNIHWNPKNMLTP